MLQQRRPAAVARRRPRAATPSPAGWADRTAARPRPAPGRRRTAARRRATCTGSRSARSASAARIAVAAAGRSPGSTTCTSRAREGARGGHRAVEDQVRAGQREGGVLAAGRLALAQVDDERPAAGRGAAARAWSRTGTPRRRARAGAIRRPARAARRGEPRQVAVLRAVGGQRRAVARSRRAARVRAGRSPGRGTGTGDGGRAWVIAAPSGAGRGGRHGTPTVAVGSAAVEPVEQRSAEPPAPRRPARRRRSDGTSHQPPRRSVPMPTPCASDSAHSGQAQLVQQPPGPVPQPVPQQAGHDDHDAAGRAASAPRPSQSGSYVAPNGTNACHQRMSTYCRPPPRRRARPAARTRAARGCGAGPG